MRGVALGAHLAADLQPRHPRQHQIEHHQIGHAALDALERLRTVGRLLDDETLLGEVVADQFANIGVVFNDQHAVANSALRLGDRVRGLAGLIHRFTPSTLPIKFPASWFRRDGSFCP